MRRRVIDEKLVFWPKFLAEIFGVIIKGKSNQRGFWGTIIQFGVVLKTGRNFTYFGRSFWPKHFLLKPVKTFSYKVLLSLFDLFPI